MKELSIIKEEDDTIRDDIPEKVNPPFVPKPKQVSAFGDFMNKNEAKIDDIKIVPTSTLVIDPKASKKERLDEKKKDKKNKKHKSKRGSKTFDDKDQKIQQL